MQVPQNLDRVDLPGEIEAFDGGYSHSVVLVGGRVFCFGANEFNAVPTGRRVKTAFRRSRCPARRWWMAKSRGAPMNMARSQGMQQWAMLWRHRVRCPSRTCICHAAAQGKAGGIYLWGCGENGQTGLQHLPEASTCRPRGGPAIHAAPFHATPGPSPYLLQHTNTEMPQPVSLQCRGVRLPSAWS